MEETKTVPAIKVCPAIQFMNHTNRIQAMNDCVHRKPQDTTLQQQTISDLMDERDGIANAVEAFLKDADKTPPWESAGAVWAGMIRRLNDALVKCKEGKTSGFDPATPGGDYSVTAFQAKRGNIVLNKATGSKRCIREDAKLAVAEFELVCETAHADGDYSYLCNNEYCRCRQ